MDRNGRESFGWYLSYISHESPIYALRTVDRITKRSQQIGVFPKSGRRVPEFDVDQIREVFSGDYRIIYRILPSQIDILAVIHGAMDMLRVKNDQTA